MVYRRTYFSTPLEIVSFQGSLCFQPLRCRVDRRRGPTTRRHQKLWRNYLRLQRRLSAAATTKVVEEALEQPITVPLPPPRVNIFERTVIPPSFGRTAQADPPVADRPPRTPYLVPGAEGLLQVTTEQVKTLVVAGTPFSEYVKEGKPLFRQPPVEVPPLPATPPTDADERPPSSEARSDSPTTKVPRPSRLKVTKVKKSKGAGPSTAVVPSPATARQLQPVGVGRPSSPPAGPSSRRQKAFGMQSLGRAISREEIADCDTYDQVSLL